MAAKLEFMIPRSESEAFNTAVYRFLELRSGASETEVAMLMSEPYGPVTRKTLTLASDHDLHDFTRFWAAERRNLKGAPKPVWMGRPAEQELGGELPA